MARPLWLLQMRRRLLAAVGASTSRMQLGVNMSVHTFLVGSRPFTNLAIAGQWRYNVYGAQPALARNPDGTPTNVDTTYYSGGGGAATGTLEFDFPDPEYSATPTRVRITGRGAMRATTTLLTSTPGNSISAVSAGNDGTANGVWWVDFTYTWGSDPNAAVSGIRSFFVPAAGATPLADFAIFIADAQGNQRDAGVVNPLWATAHTYATRVRPMDLSAINGAPWHSYEFDSRSKGNSTGLVSYDGQTRATAKIGGVTLTAVGGFSEFPGANPDPAIPLLRTYTNLNDPNQIMAVPSGPIGNGLRVQIVAATAAGSVTLSGSLPIGNGSTGLLITIAPKIGAVTEAGIITQINASSARYFVIPAQTTGDGSAAVAAGAVVPFTGGSAGPLNGGVSLELKIALCNASNKGIRIQFPPASSPDWIRRTLLLLRDGPNGDGVGRLNPLLPIELEVGNELWNGGTPYVQGKVYIGLWGAVFGDPTNAATAWFSYTALGYAPLFTRMCAIAEDVFAGQMGRIERIATNIQTGLGPSPETARMFDPAFPKLYVGDHTDRVNIAPYWATDISLDAQPYPGPDSNWSASRAFVDVPNQRIWMSVASHTTQAATVQQDPLMALVWDNGTLVRAGLDRMTYPAIDRVLTGAVAYKTMLAGKVNSQGAALKLGSYEDGPNMSASFEPSVSGSQALMTAFQTAYYQSQAAYDHQMYDLCEKERRLGTDYFDMMFADIGGTGARLSGQGGAVFGMATSDWATDATSSRRRAAKDFAAGLRPAYVIGGGVS